MNHEKRLEWIRREIAREEAAIRRMNRVAGAVSVVRASQETVAPIQSQIRTARLAVSVPWRTRLANWWRRLRWRLFKR